MADKITVLLVDDHSLVRKGFRRMLEDDPAITIEATSSQQPSTEPSSLTSPSPRRRCVRP